MHLQNELCLPASSISSKPLSLCPLYNNQDFKYLVWFSKHYLKMLLGAHLLQCMTQTCFRSMSSLATALMWVTGNSLHISNSLFPPYRLQASDIVKMLWYLKTARQFSPHAIFTCSVVFVWVINVCMHDGLTSSVFEDMGGKQKMNNGILDCHHLTQFENDRVVQPNTDCSSDCAEIQH